MFAFRMNTACKNSNKAFHLITVHYEMFPSNAFGTRRVIIVQPTKKKKKKILLNVFNVHI